MWADWHVLGRSTICHPQVLRDVGAFSHLELDAPLLLELSVGSEGEVGPTDWVISSNWADSCLSKGVGAIVPVISVRYEECVAVVLGRSMCCSQNDPLEARCSRSVRLCLEAGPSAGLGLSKGGRSAALGIIRRGQNICGGQAVSV